MIDRRKFLATMGTLPVLAAPALRAAQRPLTFRVTGSLPRSMHVEGEGWRGFEVEFSIGSPNWPGRRKLSNARISSTGNGR